MRSLKGQGRSEATIRSYLLATNQLADHVDGKVIFEITADDIRTFLSAMLDQGRASATVRQRHASLRVFFRWLADEGEISENPMDRVKAPKLEETPVPTIADADLKKLMKVTEGTDFDSTRDRAIIALLIDGGMRVGELISMTVEGVNWEYEVVTVDGKTGVRSVPFGRVAGQALDRYIRRRKSHPLHRLNALWLGHRGKALSGSGVTQMLRRRCEQAGIEVINPRRFRHQMAHTWLAQGGQEGDLMRIGGWKSRAMLSRYGSSAAEQRARDAHRQNSPLDNLT